MFTASENLVEGGDGVKKKKVLHIISGLDTGGAEMMLYKLLAAFPNQAIRSEVISLGRNGPITKRIIDLGINVQSLHLGSGWIGSITGIFLLIKYTRNFCPHVIQGWMYHGNIAATIASFFVFQQVIVCWNIRQTLQDLKNEKIITRLLIRLSPFLSRLPKYILYNSIISAEHHEKIGFYKKSRMIIPNGFDINIFRPQDQVRSSIRNNLGLNLKQVIGHIARYHPKKDHETLLRATRRIVDQIPETVVLLIGRGVTEENCRLRSIMEQLDLERNILFLGERADVSQIMVAMDVLVSSSAWGEGFPNVIGEAMASGVACVATDVGESRNIVGDAGTVVPDSSPEMLADAVIELLNLPVGKRFDIGCRARERIATNFSIQDIARQYLRAYGIERSPH